MTEHKAFDQSWFWLWLTESETRKFGSGFCMDQFSLLSSAEDIGPVRKRERRLWEMFEAPGYLDPGVRFLILNWGVSSFNILFYIFWSSSTFNTWQPNIYSWIIQINLDVYGNTCVRNCVNSCYSISIKKNNPDISCVTKLPSLKFSQMQVRKICYKDATSRFNTSSRRRPPWVDRQWEQQLTLNSVTAVNCSTTQAKPWKSYANCKSRQRPTLTINQALQTGKSAVRQHFRIFCVCLKLQWLQSSQRHCQNGVYTQACCYFQVAQAHVNEKNSFLFYCSFVPEFQ